MVAVSVTEHDARQLIEWWSIKINDDYCPLNRTYSIGYFVCGDAMRWGNRRHCRAFHVEIHPSSLVIHIIVGSFSRFYKVIYFVWVSVWRTRTRYSQEIRNKRNENKTIVDECARCVERCANARHLQADCLLSVDELNGVWVRIDESNGHYRQSAVIMSERLDNYS